MNDKFNLMFFISAIIIIILTIFPSQYVYSVFGQMLISNSTGMLSPLVNKELSLHMSQFKKVFGDKFTAELSSKCGAIPIDCLEVEYESPNTIVLQGDYLVFNSTLADNNPNQVIWKAVDNLKLKGFVIDSVVLSGVGSQGNPNVYHVIMSKK